MQMLIDTNIYCYFCENNNDVVENFRLAEKIYISLITIAELRAGFMCGTYGKENEKVLSQFLNRPRIQILIPDEETSFHYAYLFKQLRTQGTPIPTNDLWIAALAVQHNLLLYSQDKHFNVIHQLPRVT
ncbi:MAG: type II toxin-antitoxin system VapC family toxin [Spirochaetales bacterium]|nr:type II toxin-antitoxin system VapC family toxin [Spirochaetales bacterium]